MSTRVTIPEFKALLKECGYPVSTVTRKIAKEVQAWYDVCIPSNLYDKKVSRGVFKLTGATASNIDHLLYEDVKKPAPKKSVVKTPAKKEVKIPEVKTEVPSSDLTTKVNEIANQYSKNHFVPEKDPFYVNWSTLHKDIKSIVKSGIFFPVYITGLSGNGKTMTPEQIGAELNREVILVSITDETSEDDLLGSYRLIDGDTVWEDGPVTMAMKRGAVLVLDEIDLGGPAVMCLQSVLSGKGVYIKRVNRFVKPTKGFTIVATGNTKGKGDNHGMMYTHILNEAMLDRFSVTFEQDYPSVKNEVKILDRAYSVITGKKPTKKDEEFFDRLAKTGKIIRESYFEGNVEGLLSTRRLVDMLKTYIIYNRDRLKAFELGTNRFDEDTKKGMKDLYLAVDSGAHDNDGQPDALSPNENELPF